MRKLKKIILIAIVGLLAVAIIALIVVGLSLGTIVKTGVNTVGPKLTQTALTVDSVDVSLLTGSAKVENLIVGNPEEYKAKAPNAITVGKASVSVAPMSVLSDKIVVKYVRVDAPEINFEGNPLGANNLKKIQDNVNAAAASFQSAPSTNESVKSTAPAKPAKKLEVDEVTITNIKVHFNGLTLAAPDIHLTDLGRGADGITPVELTKDVLNEVVTGTLKAVASSAANVGKEATKAVSESVGKVTGGLGGLFKKNTN